MPSLALAILSDGELQADSHPDLMFRLVVDGISHDPSGRKPPERLELRLSSRALTILYVQIRAAQNAQVIQARARAERETEAERERTRAAEAAVDNTRVDTGVIRRVVVALKDKPPDAIELQTPPPPPTAGAARPALQP